ncbi:MAG: hypothetical protein ACJ79H_19490 [Myxococcales bacterium]
MRILLAAGAALLSGMALTSAGFGRKAQGPIDRCLRAALALALGIGTWSASYAAALLAFGPRFMVAKDALLAIAGGAVLASRRKPAGAPSPAPHPEKKGYFSFSLWSAFAVSALAAVGVFLQATLRNPDGGFDAFQIWNLRARFLVRGGEGFRAAFSPAMELWAHQDYPWLVPGAVAQAFLLSGGESSLVPATMAAGFAALAVAIPALTLAKERGTRWGLLGAIALLTTPCFAVFAAHQESDIPLGVYLSAAAALLVLANGEARGSPRLLLMAGFAAGLGAWTKNEGTLYAACLAAALAVHSRNPRAVAWFVAGAAPAGALLLAFKIAVAPPTDLVRFSTASGALSRALDPWRWGQLAVLTVRRIVYFQDFALWVAAEVLVLGIAVRKLPGSVPGTALFLACAAYAPIYLAQPHPLPWLYALSVERIFIQLWPAAILATLLPLARAVAEQPPQTSSGNWPMERAEPLP